MIILIDTNIFILREQDRIIQKYLQEVIQYINLLNYQIVIHSKSIDEINKDKNIPNKIKRALLSKINTYPIHDPRSKPSDDEPFIKLIGEPKNEREHVDSYLLFSVYNNEVDLLITEDTGLINRISSLKISSRILNLKDASKYFKKILEDNGTKSSEVPVLYFYKKGNMWHIGKTGNVSIYRDLKGFEYIHFLLCNENKRIPPLVLFGLGKTSGDESPHGKQSAGQIADLGLHPEGPIYNERLSQNDRALIESNIKQLESDIVSGVYGMTKIEEIKGDIELLKKYLNKKADRDSSSQSEKARSAVTRLINDVLYKRISADKSIPFITKYLNKSTIITGDNCVYEPNINDKPTWILYFKELEMS